MRRLAHKVLNIIRTYNSVPNDTFEEIVWEGKYSSWGKAIEQSKGYNDKEIVEKCKNSILKVKNGEAVYERDSFLLEHKDYSWPLVSGILMAAQANFGKLNVVDFGGSLGSTYYQVKDILESSISLKWNVIEQPEFVKTGKEYFQDENLQFYFSIDECLKENNCNLAVLSSVMQYLEDPYLPLSDLILSNVKYIIIDRTLFVKGKKALITVQTVPESIYKASYPCWLLNEEELLDHIAGRYEILASFDSKIDYCNHPESYFKGFILKRNA